MCAPTPADSTSPMLVADDRERLTVILRQVEADLTGNVLLFWLSSLDRQRGGFVTELDRHGKWTRATDKWLVAQARTVWTYAAAHRYGQSDPRHLAMAEHGVRFLKARMWDPRHGGFYWRLSRHGFVRCDHKYLYGHAFAIFALAEYYLATNDRDALSLAEETFHLLETKARDGEYGYLEAFARAWDRPLDIAWGTAVVQIPFRKTLNAHLHLMEAMSVLFRATGNRTHYSALQTLVDLIITETPHPQLGIAREPFARQWEPMPSRNGLYYTSYGHNVELAWLLVDAVTTLGESRERVRSIYTAQLDHALECGFDWECGGLATSGPYIGHVTEADQYNDVHTLRKTWWAQAESLVSTITAYHWMHDRSYLLAFEKQWEWIYTYQIDHQAGDWYRDTDYVTGRAADTMKGNHGWKTCYHNGRALIRVSQELREILGLPPLGKTDRDAWRGE